MVKTNSKAKLLTEGTPWKLILKFAIPILLGALFQQFYSMVDTMIVGRILGSDALAAVGSTGSVNFLFMGFGMGICNGFAIPIAKAFGARDEKLLKNYVGNVATLTIILCVVFTIVISLICKPFLRFMNTPEEILDTAYAYISIIFYGIAATILYNLAAGILRSLGNSRFPFIVLLLATVLNLILDIVLVYPLGVRGTALATILSQLISGVVSLTYLWKNFEIVHFKKADMKLDGKLVKDLLAMGVPMGLQSSITAIGSVVLQTAVNGLGTVAVASATAAGRVSYFLACPSDALGSAMTTYCGQNIGAGKLARVRRGVRSAVIMGLIYSAGAYLVMRFAGYRLIYLFVEGGQAEIVANATQYLMITAAFYGFVMVLCTLRYSIQGIGYGTLAMFAGAFEMLARIGVALVLIPRLGFLGACFTNAAPWVLADFFLIPAYFYVIGRQKKKFAEA